MSGRHSSCATWRLSVARRAARGVCASVLAIMRIGQDRIAVDAFLAPRLAHELVQLARRQLLAPATELVYILTPFTLGVVGF